MSCTEEIGRRGAILNNVFALSWRTKELGRRILSRSPASLRDFDAVIDGIANHVHERVGQFLDDVAVEFGVIAAS